MVTAMQGHACSHANTSKNAAHARRLLRNSNDRQQLCGNKHWPTRPTSDVAMSWPNALRHWQQKPFPRMSMTTMTEPKLASTPTMTTPKLASMPRTSTTTATMPKPVSTPTISTPKPASTHGTSMTRMTTMLRSRLRCTPHHSSLVLTPSWPKSEPWMTVLVTGLHSAMSSLLRRRTKPQLQRCLPQHPRWLCCHPPTALCLMWMQSSLPWGGALKQRLLLWHRQLYHRPPLMANSGRYADAPNFVVALVDTTVLARPVLLMRSYPPTLIQLWRVFQCQQSHLTCWQEQLHAWGCRHLSLP
jgi:hypothetical protein